MTIVKQWDSAHKCPQCGHVLKLADIDLKAATTGIVVCPNCNWSGPIDIQIVERIRPTEYAQADHADVSWTDIALSRPDSDPDWEVII
jgi:predicted RNA-binding Zn-ribbon protein involved in translation (DUF1610 family)